MNLNVFIVSKLPLDPLLLHPKAGVNNFNTHNNTINLCENFKSKIICIIDFIIIYLQHIQIMLYVKVIKLI